MFTGIIKDTATVVSHHRGNGSLFIEIATPSSWKLSLGDSLAVNGVCLTVKEMKPNSFLLELMAETLRKTSFGESVPALVNVEPPLRLSDRLDGHMVQGHVDSTGKIQTIKPDGNAKVITLSYPDRFKRQLIEKGSITVDGVSLTAIDVTETNFSVSLVQYTQDHTTLADKQEGDTVNLEFDMIAKYVSRLMEH